MSEIIMLAEHAPDLAEAVTAARTRCKDDTIMARIGEYEGRPGFVSLERHSGEIVAEGLSQDEARTALGRMR